MSGMQQRNADIPELVEVVLALEMPNTLLNIYTTLGVKVNISRQ